MTLTLEQLGGQYLNQSRAVRERAREVRQRGEKLRGDARITARRRYVCLMEIARDMETTGRYLEEYYEN